MRPFPPEASAALLPPPLLPGGAIQFPGGPFLPLWTSAFHGAQLRQLSLFTPILPVRIAPSQEFLCPRLTLERYVGECVLPISLEMGICLTHHATIPGMREWKSIHGNFNL